MEMKLYFCFKSRIVVSRDQGICRDPKKKKFYFQRYILRQSMFPLGYNFGASAQYVKVRVIAGYDKIHF